MSRSEGAWLNWTDAATPSAAKRPTSSGARSCACSIRWRRPRGSPLVPGCLEGVEGAPVGEVADRVHGHGEAGPGAPGDDVDELLVADDLDPRAVEEEGCPRAERPVQEGLDVADAQEVVPEPRGDADLREPVDVVVGERLPDAQGERILAAQALEDAQRPEPAVLVVDRGDAARVRDPDPLAAGLDHLVLGRARVGVAEVPGALLPQDAGRLAPLVALHDAARDLEVALDPGEGRGVDPQRVVVLRHERHGDVAADGVEGLLRRLDGGRPVAAAPAEPAQPAALGHVPHGRGDAGERLVEPLRTLEPDLMLRERPGGEVHVRVREPGDDAPAAQVDALGAREGGLVRADPSRHPLAGDRQGRSAGEGGVERPDGSVLEDHGRNDRSSRVASRRTSPGAAPRSRRRACRRS